MKKNVIAMLALAAFAAPALAQNYPERPIRFIVGFVPGGGANFTAVTVAEKMSELLKQPVQVENRAGAGGNLAHELVVRSKPDGYTMGLGSIGPMAINPYIYETKAFDPTKDLMPVGQLVNATPVLVVHPSLPPKNAKEFIAFLKSKPNQIQFGSSGLGSANHMAGELLGASLKSKMIHVSARGASEAITNLKAGQVQAMFSGTTAIIPLVQSKQARAIAVTTVKRSVLMQDVPTLAESSPELKGFEANNWYGIVVAAGTPRPIIEKLNGAIRASLNDPETKRKILESGLEPNPSTPEEFAKYIASENAKWMKVVRDTGLKVK